MTSPLWNYVQILSRYLPLPHALTPKHLDDDTMVHATETNDRQVTTGWNGSYMKSKDPYALMRDCNANSRWAPMQPLQHSMVD